MNAAAAILLAATAAMRLLCPSWASLLVSTEIITNLLGFDNSRWFYVEADYRTWRNISVRVPRPFSGFSCSLHVNMSAGSGHQLPCRPARVILVKIESPRQREEAAFLFALDSIWSPRNLLCNSRPHCRATYMLVDNDITLTLFVTKEYNNQSYGLEVPYFYEASFIVTEVTNVCDLASNTGELLVESNSSSEYAFAPGTALLGNSVVCTRGKEYSLTLRPRVASAHLSVTALACPSNFSCETLLLNGLSCREGETVRGPQSGYSVKIQYTYRDQCSVGLDEYSGFLVSAQVSSFAAPPIPPTPSQPSCSQSNTSVLVTAVVGTFSAAALMVSLVLALRARRQLLRRANKGQSCAPTAGSTSAGRVSDRAGDDSNPRDVAYESLRATDCEQHVYEVMVLTSAQRQ